MKSNFDAPPDPIFKEFHILKFDDIHSVELGKFMYSYKNYFLPSKFNFLIKLIPTTQELLMPLICPFVEPMPDNFLYAIKDLISTLILQIKIFVTQYLFPPLNLALNNISIATTSSVIFIFDLACYFFPQIFIHRIPCIRLNFNCINPLTVFKPYV